MKKFGLILATSWLVTAAGAKAGELDSEYRGKAKAVASAPSLGKPSSELDSESPDQAWFHGRPFFGGFGFGFGYPFFGGFGYGYPGFGGFGYGYPGFGFGGFGYGYPGFGFGGFGYGRGFVGYGRGFGGYGGFGRGFGGYHGGFR